MGFTFSGFFQQRLPEDYLRSYARYYNNSKQGGYPVLTYRI